MQNKEMEQMKKIPLTKGKVAIVDDEDFEKMSRFKWMFNSHYAKRTIYLGGGRKNCKSRCVMMHRVIAGTPPGFETDHINGDKLDNRKENLRVCTKSQNQMNRGATKRCVLGIKGVSKNPHDGKFRVKIQADKRYICLRGFETPEQAKSAYDEAAARLHGDFAKIA